MRMGVAESQGGPRLDRVEQLHRAGSVGEPTQPFRLVGLLGRGSHRLPGRIVCVALRTPGLVWVALRTPGLV